jgi:hypothetical protein
VRACSISGKECIWDIGGKTRKSDRYENLDVDGMIILKWILEN